jgi:polar amino acid transport system substrate-binding protein
MPDDRFAGLTSRRGLIRGGAALSGIAVAGVALPAYSVRAADSVNDSLLKKVLDRGKVIVGTGATNPPWHFEDDSGKPVGMDIDMAKLLAGGLFGLSQTDKADDQKTRDLVEFVVQEANQRIPNLLADKIDCVFQFMTVSAVRATQVEFTIPYYREAVTVLLANDSPYTTLADMQGKGLKLGILQNVGAEEAMKFVVPDATVEQFPSTADSIAALDSGRVDGTGVDLSTGKWFAANSPGKYKFTDSWNPGTYAAAVKPGDQIWLNFVNTVLHEGMTGQDHLIYNAAFKKWFGEDLPSPIAGFPIEYK